ncbi:hypothetical protein AX15_004063 [Amanita polypyramis BW_CC]|nr:hypothetical protein AX15_004063 [Amanita polypyramis BW_CC]
MMSSVDSILQDHTVASKVAELLSKVEQHHRSNMAELERHKQEIIAELERRKTEFLAELDRHKADFLATLDHHDNVVSYPQGLDCKYSYMAQLACYKVDFLEEYDRQSLTRQWRELELEEIGPLMEIIQQKEAIASVRGLPDISRFLPSTVLLQPEISLDLRNFGDYNNFYTAEEKNILRNALRNAEQFLRLLDVELADCQTICLTDLRRQRRIALNATQTFCAALAPHRRLPNDILQEIFLWCIEEDPTGDIGVGLDVSSDYVPETSEELSDSDLVDEEYFPYDGDTEDEFDLPIQLILSQVCSRWRWIALGTKRMWNDLRIMAFNERTMKFAHEWLSRAGNTPVSITIIDVDLGKDSDLYDTLRCFLSTYRLKRLELPLYLPTWPRLLHLFESDLSPECTAQLETLSLCDIEDATTRHYRNLVLSSFRYPNLKDIDLRGELNTSTLVLPWNTLLYLDISGVKATCEDCHRILRNCTSLEICHLWVARWAAPKSLTRQSTLRELSLHLTGMDFDDFSGALFLPNLESLTFNGPVEYPLPFAQLNFPGLRHLNIQFSRTKFDVGLLLRETPSLVDISLSHNFLFSRETLNDLAVGKLCPNLERFFVMRFEANEDESRFLEMVKSRAVNARREGGNGRQISSINHVAINYCLW